MTAAGHARTGPAPSGTTRHPGLPAGVDAWLGRAVPELRGNLRHELIAGGRSNLTYRTTDAAGHVVVLRRPPLGDHPATAHDVLREARILRGLHGHLPAPRVLAVEETGEVAGAPLVVLEHLDGTILRSPADVERLTTEADRALIGPTIVDALVALHGLGPELIGLGVWPTAATTSPASSGAGTTTGTGPGSVTCPICRPRTSISWPRLPSSPARGSCTGTSASTTACSTPGGGCRACSTGS